MIGSLPISIAIPTYRRERVLIDTLEFVLALQPQATEILVLDQTEVHEASTDARLGELASSSQIRWVRLEKPSITAAMNEALVRARGEVVLFLDDDIRPEPELLSAHWRAHCRSESAVIAGRVIQPWQEDLDLARQTGFHFASLEAATISEFIGCNFSINRALAISLGGFDENFVRVAYRFEAEFAHRLLRTGRTIHFEPTACIHHLKASDGGTRSFGEHLTTWRPDHAVGAYYYGLRAHRPLDFLVRPFRAAMTRYHLRHPWRIPATLWAEFSAMFWALALFLRGPKYLVAPREGGTR
jgi:GT2 family glycosyltransferase